MISIPTSLGFGDRLPSMPSLPSFNLAALPSFSSTVLAESSPLQELHGTPPPPPLTPKSEIAGSPEGIIAHPNTPTSQTIPVQQVSALTEITAQQYDVASWLKGLGVAAYTDHFHKQGIYYMYQLQDFGLEDLEKMMIGTQHRNQIWRSMVELRNTSSLQGNTAHTPPAAVATTCTATTSNQQVTLSSHVTEPVNMASQSSTTSTASLATQQNLGFNPGYYEVTRYTFKHTISLKKEDHDYC